MVVATREQQTLHENWTSDLLESVTDRMDNPEVLDGVGKMLEMLGIMNESGILDIVVTMMQFAGLMPDADPADVVDKLWSYYETHADWVQELQSVQVDNLLSLTKSLSNQAITEPTNALLKAFVQAGALQQLVDTMGQPEVLEALPKMLDMVGRLQEHGLLDTVLLGLEYLDALPEAADGMQAADRLGQWLERSQIVDTAAATNWANLITVTQIASGDAMVQVLRLAVQLLEEVPQDTFSRLIGITGQLLTMLSDMHAWDLVQDLLNMVQKVKDAVDWSALFPGLMGTDGHLNWPGMVKVIQNVAEENKRKTSTFGGMKGMMALMRDPDVQKGMHFAMSLAGQLSHFALSGG
ncbi:MAG: DUF1641 domain-containing protein [Sulfobacillus thermosulfidooxidans]|uniref:DUF1641 domain-containing protein n=1 Tax=Sulfobacillus TaxID=28033 RepID=UPI000CD0814D|nr:DUF1641 domain-containing protein [Sulfobacillus sp. hq2]POB12018.1 hypothetical protein CO251_01845 [Sulfobacillus sp. hq2]PSR37013.1 MAG: DUF1641 domain-containing protein [Sulfobacillus thermosulfidooxidans]